MTIIYHTASLGFDGSGTGTVIQGYVSGGRLYTTDDVAIVRYYLSTQSGGMKNIVTNVAFNATAAVASVRLNNASSDPGFTVYSANGAYSKSYNAANTKGTSYVEFSIGGTNASADYWSITYGTMLEPPQHTTTQETNPDGAVDALNGCNAISLRYGEKRETITDITRATARQPLTFQRFYRQYFQDNLRYMGLGWSHNHHIRINRLANGQYAVTFGDGGKAYLEEVNPNGVAYRGIAGFQAEMLWNPYPAPGAEMYRLFLPGGHEYRFWENGKVSKHFFPTGNYWEYNYAPEGSADDGKLRNVNDDGGNRICFRYYPEGSFKAGKLYRVGGQSASDLISANPVAPYVEFDYEQQSGSNRALLTKVRDVNGNWWTYEYQATPINYKGFQLSPIKRYYSPAVACTSTNFNANTPILLKDLAYTWGSGTPKTRVAEITQNLGEQETSGNFLRTEKYTFNEHVTSPNTEVSVAGKKTTHKFDFGVYFGKQEPTGELEAQRLDGNYRLIEYIDGEANSTKLTWTGDGNFLQQAKDAENQIVDYVYESGINGRLVETKDAVGRVTKYKYDDASEYHTPTRIRILQGETIISEIHYRYRYQGLVAWELEFDPAVAPLPWHSGPADYTETPIRRVNYTYIDNPGQSSHRQLHTVTNSDLSDPSNNQTTTYTYDSLNRVIKTQKSSLFGSCEFTHTFYDKAGNVVFTVCGHANLPQNYTFATLFDSNDPDKYRVTGYEYDTLGRRIAEHTNIGSPYQQTKYIYYDALSRVTRTVVNCTATDYVDSGRWKWNFTSKHWETAAGNAIDHGERLDQNLIQDTEYNELGEIRLKRDVTGDTTLYSYFRKGLVRKVIQHASKPNYFSGTSNEFSGLTAEQQLEERLSLALYIESVAEDQDIITRLSYNAAGHIRRVRKYGGTALQTDIDYELDKLGRRKKEIINLCEDSDPNRVRPDYQVESTTKYDGVGRVIRKERLVDNRPYQAGINNAIWRTTLFGYSTRNEPVRTIESASNANYFNLPSAVSSLSNYEAATGASGSDIDILTVRTFEEHAWLRSEKDPMGAATWYRYDGMGRVIRKIVNAVGTATNMGSADPRSDSYVPSTAADRDLITHTYYNSDGQIQRVQELRDPANPNKYWTLYDYDRAGRVTRVIKNAANASVYNSGFSSLAGYGSLSTEPDRDISTSTTYDALGRVISVKDDASGNITYTGYDQLGRAVVTVENYVASGSTSPEDWVWVNSRWEDGFGNIISHGTNNDQNLISLAYYDLAGRVVAKRDVSGQLTGHYYDNAGRLVATVENYIDGQFNAGSPAEDRITTYTYNKAGYLLQTVDPRGSVTAHAYDKLGRVVETTSAAGTAIATTTYTCYNKIGEVLRTIQNYVPHSQNGPEPDELLTGGGWAFDPTNHGPENDINLITEFKYDRAGRQTQIINPAGDSVTRTYDKRGLLVSEKNALDDESVYSYDYSGRLNLVVQSYVQHVYTTFGVQQVIEPASWSWDNTQGRWETPQNQAISHGTDNDRNLIVQMTYNKAGHLISRREPNGNLTQYEYDLLDRRKKQINPANEVWETLYTKPVGDAPTITQTYPGLNTANSAYQVTRQMDRAGRVLSINYNDPASTPDVTMTYNPAGRRLSMVETGSGSTTMRRTEYGYDSALRLTQARFDIDGNGVFEQTVNYGYDGGGLRTSLQLAHDGNKTVYYNHDAKGRLVAFMDWSNQETVFDYTNADRLQHVTRATGLNSSYAYDTAGRLVQLRHYSGTNTTVAQFDYTVNALGNRTQAVEEMMPAGGGALQPQTIKYTYDAVSRLQSATYYPNLSGTGTPSTTYSYTYDRAGNRLSETLNAQATSFTYNNRNQLTGDGTYTYMYDMNGNLLQKALGGTPVESYIWDRANRLASMGGHSYAYDGDGSRVSQTVSGMAIRYLQDAQAPLPVVLSESAGGLVTRYVHGPTGIHMQQNPNGTWLSMMQDGLGSVRGVYSGGVVSTQEYSPYGVPLDTMAETDFGFTGEVTDNNGLVYLRARYLNPSIGVFSGQDIFNGHNKYPLSLNRYTWVHGNSINSSDATGLTPMLFSGSIGGRGGGSCGGNSSSSPVDALKQACETYLGNNDIVTGLIDTTDTGNGIVDLAKKSGVIIPPWLASVAKNAGEIAGAVGNVDATIRFICASVNNDHGRMLVEFGKLIPGYGKVVAFVDEVLLDKSAASLPPVPNPQFRNCTTGNSSFPFQTRENRLATRYQYNCFSTQPPDPSNASICGRPSDEEIRAAFTVIDELQASGVIPVDLTEVTSLDIKRYSYTISNHNPYNTAISGNTILSAGWGRVPGKLAGMDTLAAFLLMARTLEHGNGINLNAFRSVLNEAGHTGVSNERDFSRTVEFLKDTEWHNVAVCDAH